VLWTRGEIVRGAAVDFVELSPADRGGTMPSHAA